MKQAAMRGELYLLLATLLAAVGWIASKLVITAVPGEMFITARFLLASCILLPFCYQRIFKLKLTQLAALCGVGLLLASSIHVWVYAVSISTTLAEGAFIMSLAMMIAPFTSWLLFQIKPNRAFWLALPIAVLGMLLLTLANGWQVEPSQWFFLLASTLLSLHFVLNKKVITSINPLTSICVQLFVVGISGAISMLLSAAKPFELNREVIFWFVVSTIVATSMRYLVQTIGQFSVKLETASLIMILEPIWTLVLSMSLLGEVVETQKLIGGGIILLSLFIYIRLSKRYS